MLRLQARRTGGRCHRRCQIHRKTLGEKRVSRKGRENSPVMGLRRDALGVDAAGDAMDERQPTTSPRIANDVAENRREKKIGGEEKKGEEDNVRLVG